MTGAMFIAECLKQEGVTSQMEEALYRAPAEHRAPAAE